MEPEKKNFSIKNFLKGLLREIVVPVLLALIVIQYVVQAFQIPSGSMEDSLKTGDFLIGLKFTYGSPIPFSNKKFPGFVEPKPGDVAIFRYPGEPEYPDGNPERYTHLFNALMFGNFYWDHNPEEGRPHLVHYADGPKDYIKRCVGRSGDTIAVHGGRLFVNGVRQDTLPGRGKWTASSRSKSPRDERENIVVPSVGDTLYVDSLSLEMAWWLRSIIAQENPDESVQFEISLWKDGVEQKNYNFEDFKIPVENDRGMALNELIHRNRMVLQHRMVQGDTISGVMPFNFYKELFRIGYLSIDDMIRMGYMSASARPKDGMTRSVSYVGVDGSMLQDLEGNVAMLNAGDESAEVSESAPLSKFEIRRKLTLGGKTLDYYVVKTPQFFMMGDNRDNSADSRYWGFVSLRNIKAKAFVIYFSFENEDGKFALGNPFTWWRLPFRIRWTRLGKVIHLID